MKKLQKTLAHALTTIAALALMAAIAPQVQAKKYELSVENNTTKTVTLSSVHISVKKGGKWSKGKTNTSTVTIKKGKRHSKTYMRRTNNFSYKFTIKWKCAGSSSVSTFNTGSQRGKSGRDSRLYVKVKWKSGKCKMYVSYDF